MPVIAVTRLATARRIVVVFAITGLYAMELVVLTYELAYRYLRCVINLIRVIFGFSDLPAGTVADSIPTYKNIFHFIVSYRYHYYL